VGRRTVKIAVVGAVLVMAAGLLGGWYVYDRTGPRDAATVRERLEADTRTLVSELGLREVTTNPIDDLGADGEDCGVWQGDRQLTRGPHRQHRIALVGGPPRGRRASELRPDAEVILDRLGYQIITDQVDFDQAQPEGIVIAEWGWSDVLEITLWPAGDTVDVTGTASCLPAG
jgi:hypothetical protein